MKSQLVTYLLLCLFTVMLVACQPLDVNVNNETNDTQPIISLPDGVQNHTQNETVIDMTPATIPTRTVDAGEIVRLSQNFAVDPDGGDLTYIFPQPFDRNGVWQTTFNDVGEHLFTVRVTDGTFVSSMDFRVIVQAVNRPPVIENVSNVVVSEGDMIALRPVIFDPDNDTVNVRYSGFMTSPTYKTTFGDAGNYSVIITATDGTATVQEEINITILRTNRPPVLQPISDITVVEGELVRLTPFAHDPDGDDVTLLFDSPFNASGVFQTQPGDAGTYTLNVTATDGELFVHQPFTLTVLQQNRPPVIDVPSVVTAQEGEVFTLPVSVSDPDGDPVSVSYSGFMQARTQYIDYGQAGEYEVTVTASDGALTTTKTVTVIVEQVKRPPIFVGDIFA